MTKGVTPGGHAQPAGRRRPPAAVPGAVSFVACGMLCLAGHIAADTSRTSWCGFWHGLSRAVPRPANIPDVMLHRLWFEFDMPQREVAPDSLLPFDSSDVR